MRKIILSVLVCLTVLINGMAVSADLLITPYENEFFMEHESEMSNASSHYMQAKVTTKIYDVPGSSKVIGEIEKGRVIHLHYTYVDEQGALWGMQLIDKATCAWFKLSDMKEYYWDFSFQMEHQNELFSSGKQIIYKGNDWLVLWEYPGSDMVSGTVNTKETQDYQRVIRAGYAYDDENGVRWLKINYSGIEGWLNTEEPLSSKKPEVMDIYLEVGFWSMYGTEVMIGCMVISVCALTGVLTILKRKRS